MEKRPMQTTHNGMQFLPDALPHRISQGQAGRLKDYQVINPTQ